MPNPKIQDNRSYLTRHQNYSARKAFATMPALPNQIPWNYLWLRRLIPYKYRTWYWSHRGWVLLYNSKYKINYEACEDYGVNPKLQPRGCIVGIVELKDVRGEAGCDYEFVPGKRIIFKTRTRTKSPAGITRRRF